MMKFAVALVLGVFLTGFGGNVFAAGQQNEAKALVKKAVAFVKANGKEKALVEFNNPKGKFVKGDLYVFVFDFNGRNLAHGANQKLVGKSMLDLKDPDGVYFVKEFIKVAKQGSGWVDYKWTNPNSKKIESKTSYVEATGEIIVICGAYK